MKDILVTFNYVFEVFQDLVCLTPKVKRRNEDEVDIYDVGTGYKTDYMLVLVLIFLTFYQLIKFVT